MQACVDPYKYYIEVLIIYLFIGLNCSSQGEGNNSSNYLHVSFTLVDRINDSTTDELKENEFSRHSYDLNISSEYWKITKTWPNGSFTKTFCDGTNIYRLGSGPQDIESTCMILPGLYPHMDYTITVPWLAFCSARYLPTNNQLPALWLRTHSDAQAHIYNCQIESINGDSNNLPLNIRWIVSDERKKIALTNEFLNPYKAESLSQVINQKIDLTNGFISAYYHVDKYTNINNVFIPLIFSLDVYSVRHRNSKQHDKPQYKIVRQMIGTVDALRIIHDNLSLFDDAKSRLSLPLYIHDHRFKTPSGRPISYRSSNGWVIDTNSPIIKNAINQAIANEAIMKSYRFKHRFSMIILFLLIGGSILFVRLIFPVTNRRNEP